MFHVKHRDRQVPDLAFLARDRRRYGYRSVRLPAEHEGTSSVELTPPPEITRKRALTGLPFRQV